MRLVGPDVFWDETGRGNTEADHSVYSTHGCRHGHAADRVHDQLRRERRGGQDARTARGGRALLLGLHRRHRGDCGLLQRDGCRAPARRRRPAVRSAVHWCRGRPGPAFLADAARRLLEVPGVISNFQIAPTHDARAARRPVGEAAVVEARSRARPRRSRSRPGTPSPSCSRRRARRGSGPTGRARVRSCVHWWCGRRSCPPSRSQARA